MTKKEKSGKIYYVKHFWIMAILKLPHIQCANKQGRKDKMAVAQIRVKGKNLFLPELNGTGELKAQKTQVLGWTVSIQQNGTVICYKAQKAYDGWHTKRMVITPKGKVKITMKIGLEETQTVKKYFLASKDAGEYELDASIVLADGWVDDVKACYVREGKLQDFLDQNKITSIHVCNPNKTRFTLKKLIRADGQFRIEDIKTDGEIITIAENDKSSDFYTQSNRTVIVQGATWVLKTETQNMKYNVPQVTSVLFTAVKDVTQLDLS